MVSRVEVVPREADVWVEATVPSAEEEDDDSRDSVDVRESGEPSSSTGSSLLQEPFGRKGDRDNDCATTNDGRGMRASASAFGSMSMAAEVRDVRGEP